MKKDQTALIFVLILAFILTSCATPARTQPTATPLPSPALTLIPVQSPTSAPIFTPTVTPTSAPLPTLQGDCTDNAEYTEDVTIPDNTRLREGEKFTKTWRLRNIGKCTWNIRYALVFVGGDQMGAQVTTPLSETPPGAFMDVSVNLAAPAKDGIYTALFELRTPTGRAIQIGQVTSIWVKITVGNVGIATAIPVTTSPAGQQPIPVPAVSEPCSPQKIGTYADQIFSLINNARVNEKLPSLNRSGLLDTAAQKHSEDMACNNFVDHTGSNGSSIHQRLVAAGYAPSYSEEIIYTSGTPQDAFNWWINDKTHRGAILNPDIVDVGLGFIYATGSAYGGYYTVDFAAP